jgi:hypothetical protein
MEMMLIISDWFSVDLDAIDIFTKHVSLRTSSIHPKLATSESFNSSNLNAC